MKSLDILLEQLDEAHTISCASLTRDRMTILSRLKHEGSSFLGITLPMFSDWLTSSIDAGRIATSIYSRFRKRPKSKSVLPCFLHGLTCRVFDSKTGEVLPLGIRDQLAVKFIQQICLYNKKEFVVCDPVRDQKAKDSFVQLDLDLRRMPKFPSEKALILNAVCRRFLPSVESGFVRAIDDESILPRHGPGATADKAWANGKYRGRDFLVRWDHLFSWEHLYGFSTVHQSNREVTLPRSELPVKVVSVPKTMKTSRIICVEPTAMQMAQQLTAARLVKSLQFARPFVRKCNRDPQGPRPPTLYSHLNFNDQSLNQEAARIGSITGEWATVDLSEASDRVSCQLVSLVFRHSPTLKDHLFGCRTTRAVMPDGELLHLRKYASMGSALTFPVEALCFLMICISAVCDQRNVFTKSGRVRSSEAFEKARKGLLVFGDDLIVPADSIVKVKEYLSAFGLKVNERKTFSQGGFRESCGTDWMDGVLVTPTYLRQQPPRSRKDAVKFVSWVHMANRFFRNGFPRTAHRIADYIDKIYKLPTVQETCGGLGWHFYREGPTPSLRWNKKTNSSETVVNTLVVGSTKFSDELSEYDRLLFFHLNRGFGEEYLSDPTQSPKRNSLKLRIRKVRPW